jgi:hypothetical protein
LLFAGLTAEYVGRLATPRPPARGGRRRARLRPDAAVGRTQGGGAAGLQG